MIETKHTPEPWTIDEDGMICHVTTDPFTGKRVNIYVAEICFIGPGTLPAQRANARLIAAAPDMLEALENLENDALVAMPATAWQMVQDAIAKARGTA